MAVKNFPDISPDANPSFTLENNTSSFESALNKNVQHMELPGARWRGSVAFSNRTRQEANKIKAFMTSLGGQVGRFYLTPFDAYQSGTMSGTGVVDGAVASGVSSLPTKGWEADQDSLFEAGDYIEVNGELKMVTGDVSAPQSYIEYTDTNYMPSPFDPSGYWSATDPDCTFVDLSSQNPSGSPTVANISNVTGFVPINQPASGATGLSILAGESMYVSFIIEAFEDFQIFYRFDGNGGQLVQSAFNVLTQTSTSTINITELGSYKLIQIKYTAIIDLINAKGWFFVSNASGITTYFNAQATFFGKANDWPAQLLATADIPIAPPLRKALSGGESIITNEPKGKFYLGSNDQSWDINVNGVQSMGFDFIEDVN